MSKVFQIAIVGFGNRGLRYMLDFRESLGDKMQVAAVVDPDIAGAKRRLEESDVTAAVYATVNEMVAAGHDIDGIIIASPDDCHLESFLSVKHLNKPILMEKPLEGNIEHFQKLAPELLAYKAPILVGHCMRHSPILKKAKELIDQGWIGKVTSMRFVQNCHYGDVFFRGWHRRSEAITSLYLEKASHDFDIMHMMNGDSYAKSVFAFSKRYMFGGDKPNDLTCADCPENISCSESLLNQQVIVRGESVIVERVGQNKCVWAQEADIGDDEMCMIEFANGVQGSYIQTFYTPDSYKGRVYTIVGKGGVMEIDMGHADGGSIAVHQRCGTKEDSMRFDFSYLGRNHYNGDTFLVRNFLGVIQGTEKPWTTVKAAIAAEETGLAAVRSLKNRAIETVD